MAEPKKGVVRFKSYLSNTVLDACLGLGWQQVDDADPNFDIFWCDTGWIREVFGTRGCIPDHARVCHFAHHYELTRKDHVAKNVKALQRKLEKQKDGHLKHLSCDFMPATFWLPHDYGIFVECFKQTPGSVWIMKPVGSAQGRGIFLIKKLSEILAFKKDTRFKDRQPEKDDGQQAYIVQRYLENPYLIGGRKFDLRLYVLVNSYQPLECWIYREGFARFSGAAFSMDDISDSQVHLTNVAIQKKAEGYDKNKGCKWLMTQVRRYMSVKHGDASVEKMLNSIYSLIVSSLHAVQPRMTVDKHCFEIYGYDVLIDTDLHAWLIEVNASPSLTADTQTDYRLKREMLEDAFTVLDLENKRKGGETRIGNFDLLWNNGPVSEEKPFNGHLGASTSDRRHFLP